MSEIFRQRRDAVLQALPENSVALVASGKQRIRNRDSEYPFRVDSDFWYLTGFDEPDAILLLQKSRNTAQHIFLRPKDSLAEQWTGRRLGSEAAPKQLQIDAAFARDTFADKLEKYLCDCSHLYTIFGQQLSAQLQRFLSSRLSGRKTEGYPQNWHDLASLVHEMRIRKQPHELDAMRHAAMISSLGHRQMMRKTQPDMYEYQLAACMHYETMMQGAQHMAYSPIVASGNNACILHYTDNASKMTGGDLVLIDAGCEWNYYASDITRTFPVSGKFSQWQKDLYLLVLRAQKNAIAKCVVGATLEEVHQEALDVLCDGLIDMALLQGPREKVLQEKLYTKYYMHGTSHWLGLDVHDAGAYKVDGNPRKLEEGMVLTVEPGLYIAKNDQNAPEQWRGCGIRIEDNIHITQGEAEVLTLAAVKEPDDMEAVIGISSGRRL